LAHNPQLSADEEREISAEAVHTICSSIQYPIVETLCMSPDAVDDLDGQDLTQHCTQDVRRAQNSDSIIGAWMTYLRSGRKPNHCVCQHPEDAAMLRNFEHLRLNRKALYREVTADGQTMSQHLNKVTEFDAEPIPDPEVLFASLQSKQHFTKIDLAKGYWQIPMAESDRTKTAFRTPQGLYQFKKMPFGMSTAPSTFARMMKKLDLDRFKSVHFFDDVLVATEDWPSHLQALDGLLTELGKHGLTVRPSKVEAGFDSIEFLGHIVGEGSMRPVPAKVSKILNVTVPTTKKQVRSLIGLVSFYRRYVSNFASIVSPLVELTKKSQPNKVRWSDECQRAFDLIKNVLSSEPVVRLPDFSRPFTVRSDASSTGIGAALMQSDDDGVLHPVLYASRKLLDRETRYSTVERECLALVWAVDKFHRYLFGSHFFVETDHRPLTYLKQSKTPNGRLLRWALSLQEHSFTVVPIAGVRNFEADVLSRLTK
jgi:hypothetical protein